MSKQELLHQVIYSVFVRNHTKEGTFRGLESDLDRLRGLGTDIIWLMPIHPIGVEGKKGTLGCPYANRDYRSVNPAYGTMDGIVINPAAYTHTSVAILDALKAVSIPAVEVHISDVDARESFRQISYAGLACVKTIKGHGFAGYQEAMAFLKEQYSH